MNDFFSFFFALKSTDNMFVLSHEVWKCNKNHARTNHRKKPVNSLCLRCNEFANVYRTVSYIVVFLLNIWGIENAHVFRNFNMCQRLRCGLRPQQFILWILFWFILWITILKITKTLGKLPAKHTRVQLKWKQIDEDNKISCIDVDVMNNSNTMYTIIEVEFGC